jgi:transcription antitermination factor NusG
VVLPERVTFRPGDQVRVLTGPLSGHLAIFAGMKPRQRVEVLLTMLGALQKVELPKADIEAAVL